MTALAALTLTIGLLCLLPAFRRYATGSAVAGKRCSP
jgi:hypothetical protein